MTTAWPCWREWTRTASRRISTALIPTGSPGARTENRIAPKTSTSPASTVGYYDEYIPGILQEIIERSHPEGFGDNSWSGLQRNSICYCENCARKFRDKTGQALPKQKDWNSPVYRQWIDWNYARRVEIWDNNNRVTKAAGGPDCLWLGMNSGNISSQSNSFRDMRAICKRSEFLLLDHQSRNDATGFQQNGETGKLVHGMTGWDKVIIESMALYQQRNASKPEPEARMWMIEGIASGIRPMVAHGGSLARGPAHVQHAGARFSSGTNSTSNTSWTESP